MRVTAVRRSKKTATIISPATIISRRSLELIRCTGSFRWRKRRRWLAEGSIGRTSTAASTTILSATLSTSTPTFEAFELCMIFELCADIDLNYAQMLRCVLILRYVVLLVRL